MKKFKNAVAVLLAAAMLLTCAPFAFAESEATGSYTITNPYENINWETINQYKTALHTHTNASDGDDTLTESIQRHYETGFDVVSITDHGVSDMSWTDSTLGSKFITTVMTIFGKSDGNLDYYFSQPICLV